MRLDHRAVARCTRIGTIDDTIREGSGKGHTMPNARAKNAAAEAVEAAPNGEVASTITFVDALPEKPKVTRQSWWDSITPQLDARPGEWALVYTGVGDDDTKADRNALSRVVRTRRSLKDADLLDTTYSIEKRGNKVYAQRVA